MVCATILIILFQLSRAAYGGALPALLVLLEALKLEQALGLAFSTSGFFIVF
jgi:hypothetical protein